MGRPRGAQALTMHRFFVSPEALQDAVVRLPGDLSRQIARVLRLAPGDEITLLDNAGLVCVARLEHIDPRRAVARVISRQRVPPEAAPELLLYQAMPRAKKLEWVLQKGTELGVSVFVPMVSARCQGVSPADLDESKLARWQRIVTEAAEQSQRNWLPRVVPPLAFAQAAEAASRADLPLIAAMSTDARPLREVMTERPANLDSVALLVGPEGGFAEKELALAAREGVIPISLGARVLRTETAALVAFSAILYALGELG